MEQSLQHLDQSIVEQLAQDANQPDLQRLARTELVRRGRANVVGKVTNAASGMANAAGGVLDWAQSFPGIAPSSTWSRELFGDSSIIPGIPDQPNTNVSQFQGGPFFPGLELPSLENLGQLLPTPQPGIGPGPEGPMGRSLFDTWGQQFSETINNVTGLGQLGSEVLSNLGVMAPPAPAPTTNLEYVGPGSPAFYEQVGGQSPGFGGGIPSVDLGPVGMMPSPPVPQMPPRPDFSGAMNWIEKIPQPEMMTADERSNMRLGAIFQSMMQAVQNPGSVGEMLLQLGLGAVGGLGQANNAEQAEEQAYRQAMIDYASMRAEVAQGQASANLQYDTSAIQLMNDHRNNVWKTQLDNWKLKQPRVESTANGMITYSIINDAGNRELRVDPTPAIAIAQISALGSSTGNMVDSLFTDATVAEIMKNQPLTVPKLMAADLYQSGRWMQLLEALPAEAWSAAGLGSYEDFMERLDAQVTSLHGQGALSATQNDAITSTRAQMLLTELTAIISGLSSTPAGEQLVLRFLGPGMVQPGR